MLDFVLRLIVESILEAFSVLVFFTGKLLVRGLSFGYLSVPVGRNRPFAVCWREGQGIVINGLIALFAGWAFWIALFVCAVILFR